MRLAHQYIQYTTRACAPDMADMRERVVTRRWGGRSDVGGGKTTSRNRTSVDGSLTVVAKVHQQAHQDFVHAI